MTCAARPNTGGSTKRTVNLAAYVGQSVTLQVHTRGETNATVNSNLFVDDVNFE